MNKSSIITTTFCRKCKKLRSCLNTHNISKYRYLCIECAKNDDLVVACTSCGREGTKEILDFSGYCHLCYKEHEAECSLCGAETFSNKLVNGVCQKCLEGENKKCQKCGTYVKKEELSSMDLCSKCSIKTYKKLTDNKIKEVVTCIECGRESYVADLDNKGLCIYCKCDKLESEVKKLKSKKKAYKY